MTSTGVTIVKRCRRRIKDIHNCSKAISSKIAHSRSFRSYDCRYDIYRSSITQILPGKHLRNSRAIHTPPRKHASDRANIISIRDLSATTGLGRKWGFTLSSAWTLRPILLRRLPQQHAAAPQHPFLGCGMFMENLSSSQRMV